MVISCFLFFQKEQIEKFHAKDSEHYKFYEKLLDRVFVSTQVKAESSKAKEVSFEKCCLAFDVLKIFLCDFFNPTQKFLIDIDLRASFNFTHEYFSVIDENFKSIRFNLSANNQPFILDDEILLKLRQKGLGIFSKFINSNLDNELKYILINAIKTFAVSITNDDLHLRISLLLSVSEMLLLKEDERNYTACLCQKRFISILKKLYLTDKQKAIEVLSEFYIIRNKYLHNGKRMQINPFKLSFFQELVRILLINIIEISDKYANKNAFLDNYNLIEECKKEANQKKKQ